MLFFWDILFGTAKITRKFPSEYSVENLLETTISEQLLWPFFPQNKNTKYIGSALCQNLHP
ncbi:MAG: hypothetical protein COA69_04295 [Robiginitomaculum sp.]|nr:MAG: hypothetical protein COA69_04295 [Robiginitomaculum sp.]